MARQKRNPFAGLVEALREDPTGTMIDCWQAVMTEVERRTLRRQPGFGPPFDHKTWMHARRRRNALQAVHEKGAGGEPAPQALSEEVR